MEHVHHVCIVLIFLVIDIEHLLIVQILLGLVKNAQHTLKPVVHLSLEQGYLHNNAIMGETFHKRFFLSLRHDLSIIVEHIMVDIDHRFLDVAHAMAKQINSYHRIGKPFRRIVTDIYLVAVLCTKILAKAQRLGIEPCLLQLNQDYPLLHFPFPCISLSDRCRKVYAKHGERVTRGVGIFVRSHLYPHDLFLQQG